MAETEIWTFFYGSYMSLKVLQEVDYVPRQHEVARLPGFDIRIGPLANLVRSDEHTVYGIVATGTHRELERLYQHAANVLGGTYLPEAVLVQTVKGFWRPALTYIAADLHEAPADKSYVERILRPAREFGFPRWYLDRLNQFL